MFEDTDSVTAQEVEADAPFVATYLEYIRWLADALDDEPVAPRHLWELYHYVVREGRTLAETCAHLGLPPSEEADEA